MGSIHIDLSGMSHPIDVDGSKNVVKEVDFMPKPKTPMHLTFNEVCCYVPAHFEVPGMMSKLNKLKKAFGRGKDEVIKGADKKERQILHNITGVVNPGEVVAIMGPSGSGKTTFISLLAGRNKARHTGSILYNDQHKPTDKAFKRQLGYVTQEDALYEGLTVFETLYYTAVLRLPRAMTEAEKRERVYIILEVLGISKVKGSIIGGFRVGRRGISGGEKKRVAIGQELLYNPSVILLDEPTSGLDSTTALNLIGTLETLAQVGNRTIVTTIHQPSSRIYQMLDKLLLMGQGHLLFYGDASAATDYFAEIGYAMPYGMNPADYFLDVASGWSGDGSKKAKDRTSVVQNTDPELKALLRAIERGRGLESKGGTDTALVPLAIDKKGGGGLGEEYKKELGATFATQVRVIAIRSLKDRRFEKFSVDTVFTMMFVAVLCGMLWWQSGLSKNTGTTEGAMDVSGVLFFMLTYLSFSLLFSSIFTFPNEKTMLMKERASGMYCVSAFFFGRTLADLPLDTCLPLLVSTGIYVMVGLKASVGAYVLSMCIVLLVCFTAASLGLFLGAWFLNLKRAQSAATVLMLTIMLTGGFFVRTTPAWMSWAKYLSYIMYGWSAMVKLHLRGALAKCGGENPSTEGICDYGALGVVKSDAYGGTEVSILLCMLIALRALVYIALRYRAHE
ncbi:G-family ABC transporter [Chloropicon primus]|uniref:G-family ABC transporter n=2 Tax=Chloropicon primus TaxID=1764295 RepID=A0A5B8MG22_9CHLO|nr:G-family ABC transporter [Chloropicon primus]UPQ98583.1 G-family ABC transporter [Chloropicon primus]|eukprot:QDZ19373.1 G-family ABC transporter [Chloropicon primus]